VRGVDGVEDHLDGLSLGLLHRDQRLGVALRLEDLRLAR
jgi:hypothetical protein